MPNSQDLLADELNDVSDQGQSDKDSFGRKQQTEPEKSAELEKREQVEIKVRPTLMRLMSYLFRHKALLCFAIVFLILTGTIEASFVKSIDTILKSGFLNGDDWFVRWSGMLLMGVLAARAITGYIGNYTMAKAGRLVIFELRRDIFGNMISLPSPYFDKHSSAETISKLIYDVETTSVAITDTLSIMFRESSQRIQINAFVKRVSKYKAQWEALVILLKKLFPAIKLLKSITAKSKKQKTLLAQMNLTYSKI